MGSLQKILFMMMMLNILGLIIFSQYLSQTEPKNDEDSDTYTSKYNLKTKQGFENEPLKSDHLEKTSAANKVEKIMTPKLKTSSSSKLDSPLQNEDFKRETNPFYILGAYPKVEIKVPYENRLEKNFYNKVNYGLYNDDDYCDRVDNYNLAHPANMFKKKNFFTDYDKNHIVRTKVISKIGTDVWKEFSKRHKMAKSTKRKYHLDTKINTFFINMDGFHKYHEIGKNFLCATQMYSKIPGSRALIRKDDLVASIDHYAEKFNSKPQCFNKQMFFPDSYRLYIQNECKIFFGIINSKAYKTRLETEPIQYLIKIGHGSHSGVGVFLLDVNQTNSLNKKYNSGAKCGNVKDPLIAQAYITNPLLLDLNNKFDFRIYMVIASTNPLIVFYHDGFLRVSISSFDKFSPDREKHLTNSHVAEAIFKKAKHKKVNGMTEKELKDYHIWDFVRFQNYLLESGKINDPKWLENFLRPQFKKAIIHLVKMSSAFFWKQSNVYGLFGLDFMLDENFNLWFIEANPDPELLITKKFKGDLLVLRSLFEVEYALYRSRMKRVLPIIRKLQKKQKQGISDFSNLQKEYQQAIMNKFDTEYKVPKTNSLMFVMDESLPASQAYNGNIDLECLELI